MNVRNITGKAHELNEEFDKARFHIYGIKKKSKPINIFHRTNKRAKEGVAV